MKRPLLLVAALSFRCIFSYVRAYTGIVSDGREEREERERRIEREKQEDREDRINREVPEEWQPERVDS